MSNLDLALAKDDLRRTTRQAMDREDAFGPPGYFTHPVAPFLVEAEDEFSALMTAEKVVGYSDPPAKISLEEVQR